ncbi:MAG TPA: glycosyltransferase family 10 [Anaerovoracaceae bacterium]|nr:glycosyltransferase family 10 [Anaerovoracaceae bacterium]
MIKINIVDFVEKSLPKKVYENGHGEVWWSAHRIPEMHNISMGWESIRNPSEDDSLLVLEPYCVSPTEYDASFAKKFKYVFTWAPQVYQGSELKVIQINHPGRRMPFNPDALYQKSMPWKQRANEVAFIFNNKFSSHDSQLYSLRLQLADAIHETHQVQVAWYGFNRLYKSYYKGSVVSKDPILEKTRFVVCMENSYDPLYSKNYFTEKLPDVIESGAVPLYMGCHNIDDLGLHKDSYIDLRKFISKNGNDYKISIDALNRTMVMFTKQQHDIYKQAMIENVKNEKLMYNLTSYSRMYETMIKAYGEINE